MIQDIGGEKAVEIHRHPAIKSIEWAPDGLELVFTTWEDSQELLAYTIPRLGGTPRPVTFPGSLVGATWSPDGASLAATSYPPKEIWIHDRNTQENRTLTLPRTFMAFNGIDWSPRGDRLLALVRLEGSRSEIWTVRPDGTAAEKAAENIKLIHRARWAPDGKSIYYALPHRNTKELWKVAIDPSTGRPQAPPTRILTGWESWIGWSLSADASRLVSTRQSAVLNINMVEAENDGPDARITVRQLTQGTQIHIGPSLSPDETKIVCARGTGLNSFGKLELAEIVVVPLDGGPARQLTFTERPKAFPVWSPDGARVAYMAEMDSGDWRIFVISAGGGQARMLEHARPDNQKPMIWAPGERLLYWHSADAGALQGLRVIDASGGDPIPVLEESWDTRSWFHDYSPDGTQVVYSQTRSYAPSDAPAEIRIASVSGGGSRVLLRESGLIPLEWSSDGRHIYAIYQEPEKIDRADAYRIRKIDVKTGTVTLGWEIPPDLMGYGLVGVELFREGRLFLSTKVEDIRSDVWMVENFDPAVR